LSSVHEILENIKNNKLSIEEAENQLNTLSFSQLDFAKLDFDRKKRTGFNEVVFCQNKKDEYLVKIFAELYKKNGEVLGTRASLAQAELIKRDFSSAQYDEVSRIISLRKADKKLEGNIAVCCAGTADLPVAEEASKTAEFFGSKVSRFYDVGVSGLQRLLHYLPEIEKANCIIAIAGMEGALASVIGGLVSLPVIAVPTSVGYGASFGGLSALLTMINSCANGISVVNIDNGYGAAYISTQINRLAVKGRVKDDFNTSEKSN